MARPAHHTYRLPDGQEIPSVSTIVSPIGGSYYSAEMAFQAATGSAVHKLAERAMRGQRASADDVMPEVERVQASISSKRQTLSIAAARDIIDTAWMGFRAWRVKRDVVTAESVPAPLVDVEGRGPGAASELALVAIPHGTLYAFGGRLDLVVQTLDKGRRKRILTDLKTRSADNVTGSLPTADRAALAQIGGYSLLWRLNYPTLPLDGALVLVLARNRVCRECREAEDLGTQAAEHECPKLFREEWVHGADLVDCEHEFMGLLAMYWHHRRRVERRKVSRQEERAARKGAA